MTRALRNTFTLLLLVSACIPDQMGPPLEPHD